MNINIVSDLLLLLRLVLRFLSTRRTQTNQPKKCHLFLFTPQQVTSEANSASSSKCVKKMPIKLAMQ